MNAKALSWSGGVQQKWKHHAGAGCKPWDAFEGMPGETFCKSARARPNMFPYKFRDAGSADVTRRNVWPPAQGTPAPPSKTPNYCKHFQPQADPSAPERKTANLPKKMSLSHCLARGNGCKS